MFGWLALNADRVWKDRAPRYARFFGPNVRATLKKYDSAKRLVELSLITVAEVTPSPSATLGAAAPLRLQLQSHYPHPSG